MDRYSNRMMKDVHVVIVEDEVIIAMDIQQCLEVFGYTVDEVASTTDEALFNIEKYLPNIVLMDIKLKGSTDGTEIVETIQQKYNIPVVYLSSYTDSETLKRAGATKPYGYIVKPVDENQLNSAILIALARFEEDNKLITGEVFRLSSNYSYNIKDQKLYYLGENVNLTKREKDFFIFMMDNVNKAVDYEKIIKNVWQSSDVPTSTLRSLVRRVRDKLKDDIIQNVSSKGYMIKG